MARIDLARAGKGGLSILKRRVGGGGVARADDGDAGPQQHVDPAENGDQRRGGVDRLNP